MDWKQIEEQSSLARQQISAYCVKISEDQSEVRRIKNEMLFRNLSKTEKEKLRKLLQEVIHLKEQVDELSRQNEELQENLAKDPEYRTHIEQELKKQYGEKIAELQKSKEGFEQTRDVMSAMQQFLTQNPENRMYLHAMVDSYKTEQEKSVLAGKLAASLQNMDKSTPEYTETNYRLYYLLNSGTLTRYQNRDNIVSNMLLAQAKDGASPANGKQEAIVLRQRVQGLAIILALQDGTEDMNIMQVLEATTTSFNEVILYTASEIKEQEEYRDALAEIVSQRGASVGAPAIDVPEGQAMVPQPKSRIARFLQGVRNTAKRIFPKKNPEDRNSNAYKMKAMQRVDQVLDATNTNKAFRDRMQNMTTQEEFIGELKGEVRAKIAEKNSQGEDQAEL